MPYLWAARERSGLGAHGMPGINGDSSEQGGMSGGCTQDGQPASGAV